ncbi:unnamed protein product [Caretta caretta]
MGELGWLLLTVVRAQDEEVLRLQRALEGKTQECTAQAEARAVAQEVVTSQAERAQELTRRCEVLVARVANKRHLKHGRQPVTITQVHAVTAAPSWYPETWDGNIWDSSSSEEEEDTPVVALVRPVRELRAQGGTLQPEVIRTFKTSELQEIVKTFRQEPGESILRWLMRVWDNAAIRWPRGGVQHVLALIDTGAKVTILHSVQAQGQAPVVKGLGEAETPAHKVTVTLSLAKTPRFRATVLAAAIEEYILGIDVLQGCSVDTQCGLFAFGHPRYVSMTRVREVWALTILRGSSRWEPIVLPPPTAVVSKKQCRLPGGEEEITQIISTLLEAKVIRPTLSPYNSPLWPVRKPNKTWRMTVDYRDLNKVTPPLTAVVPDMVTLIERIAAAALPWHAVLDLANAFFSIAIAPGSQKQFVFSWQACQYTFYVLPQG